MKENEQVKQIILSMAMHKSPMGWVYIYTEQVPIAIHFDNGEMSIGSDENDNVTYLNINEDYGTLLDLINALIAVQR